MGETGVSDSQVTITSVEDRSARRRHRRRLDGHDPAVEVEFIVLLPANADSSSVVSAIDPVSATFGTSFSDAFVTAAAGTALVLPSTLTFGVLHAPSTIAAFTPKPTHTPTAAPTTPAPTPKPAGSYEAYKGLTPREKAALGLCLVIGILIMVAGAVYL